MIMAMNATTMGAATGLLRRAVNGRPIGSGTRTPGRIATKPSYRRPIRHGRRRRRFIEMREIAGAIDYLAAQNGEVAGDVGDLAFGAGEEIAVRHDQVGELPDFDPPPLALFIREPGDVFRPHAQGRLAVEAVAARIEVEAADGLAGDQPGQCYPGIVGSNAGRIGTG